MSRNSTTQRDVTSGAAGSRERVSDGAMARIGEGGPVAAVELNQAPTADAVDRMMTVVNADLNPQCAQVPRRRVALTARIASSGPSAERATRLAGRSTNEPERAPYGRQVLREEKLPSSLRLVRAAG